jgi:hypothetical protein
MMQNLGIQNIKSYLLTIEYVYLLAQKSNLTILAVILLDSIPIKALAAAIINNNKATCLNEIFE